MLLICFILELSVGILKTCESGHISNISAFKGRLASPCFCKLTDFKEISNDGNYATVARISRFDAQLPYLVRLHSACMQPVAASKTGYSCNHCQCLSLEIEPECSPKVGSNRTLQLCFFWQYI